MNTSEFVFPVPKSSVEEPLSVRLVKVCVLLDLELSIAAVPSLTVRLAAALTMMRPEYC